LGIQRATLSRREREVMGLVFSSMPNKQVDGRLGNERSHWPTEPPVILRHD
jgi:FixJ family two-component response regulator